jgi:hypothetical protein
MTFLEFYHDVRSAVIESSFQEEINWQNNIFLDSLTETDLLRETAWVIINSGFRESIARRHFSNLSLSFGDWESARHIVSNRELCISCALDGFGHVGKVKAIESIADCIFEIGFEKIKSDIINDPIPTLQTFPYIGPITVWHLAKNIGCDVAKPDRHLVQTASSFGFDCVHKFCREISKSTGEKVSVIDIIIWRYCSSLSKQKPISRRGG